MCHCCQPCFPLCTLSSYIIELSSLNKLQIIKNEMLQRYVRCKIKRKNIITRVDRKRFWPSTIHFSEILLVRQCWNYAAVWQNAGAVLCYVNFTRVTCSYWSTYAFLWVSSWGMGLLPCGFFLLCWKSLRSMTIWRGAWRLHMFKQIE